MAWRAQVPPHAGVIYDVTLVDFVPAKESYEMDDQEKVRGTIRVTRAAGGHRAVGGVRHVPF